MNVILRIPDMTMHTFDREHAEQSFEMAGYQVKVTAGYQR